MSPPRDEWKVEVGDRLCALVDLVIGLSTAALVLPAVFLRTFLAVPEGKSLLEFLHPTAYVAVGGFGVAVFLGLIYRYTMAKWVKDAWGQPVTLSSRALESILNWSFWLMALFFLVGIAAFLMFAAGVDA
jgi:hypothetical protein